jgi:subtilisin family serine protease
LLRDNNKTAGDRQHIDHNPYDEHGHGTAVASVIVSVAPKTKVMTLRTHNNFGQSDCHAIANAIIYAVLNGAHIINLSSGDSDHSPLFHTAIKFATAMEVVIVASAGNKGDTRVHYPSDLKEVICVGGVSENLQRIFN